MSKNNRKSLAEVLESNNMMSRFRLTVATNPNGEEWKNLRMKSVTDEDFDILSDYEYDSFTTDNGTELTLRLASTRQGKYISLNFDERETLEDMIANGSI